MAVMKAARKDKSYKVICNVPDFCWAPPAPNPVPFFVFIDLGDSKGVAENTLLNGKPAFVHGESATKGVKGDQPAKAGLATATKEETCFSLLHSFTVKIGGKYIVRTGDIFWMNNRSGGRVNDSYNECVSCKNNEMKGAPVNPILGIKLLPGEQDFNFDGPMPLNWSRSYYSDQEGNGWLGQGWSVFYSTRLIRKEDRFTYIDEQGREISLPFMEEDEEAVYHATEQIWFKRLDNGKYEIASVDQGVKLWFAPIGLDQHDPQGENSHYLPLVAMVDRNEHHQRLIYDEYTQQLKELIDSSGRVIQFHFSDITKYNDQLKQQLSAPLWRLTEITWKEYYSTDPNQKGKGALLVRYGYSEEGDLITVENAQGVVTRQFAYRNHVMIKHQNAAGYVSQYEYDEYSKEGRVLHNFTSLDEHWYFDYQPGHTIVTDPLGREETFVYDFNREIIAHKRYDDVLIETERDNYGRVLLETDALGRETRYTYTLEGQINSITNALGQTTNYTYNEQYQLQEVIDAQGNSTDYTYDEKGNLLTVTDSKKNVTEYQYNHLGLPVVIQNAKGGETQLEYDHKHQLIALTDCSQKRTELNYDAKGNLIRVIDALGYNTHYQYNEQNHLTRISYPDGSTEQYHYDEAGRLIQHLDGLGNPTEYQYSQDGLPIMRTNALGHQFHYHYDLARRLNRLTNENKDNYYFQYDILDNLIGEIGFDGKATGYHYNLASELVQEKLYGQVNHPNVDLTQLNALIQKTYERDALGQLTAKNAHDSQSAQELHSTFQYNELNQLIQAKNEHSLIQLDYDPLGQLICERTYDLDPQTLVEETFLDPNAAKTVQYFYDELGNRIATVLPTGQTINYLYYGSGHLHQINIDGKVISDFERDDLHREISRSQGKLTSFYDLDPMGRIKQQVASFEQDLDLKNKNKLLIASGPVKRSYQYDKAGNLTRMSDNRGSSLQYVYDKIGRITQAGQELFAFDPAHNIIDAQENSQPKPKQPIKDKAYYEHMLSDPTWSPLKDDPEVSPIDKQANRVQSYQGITYHYDELGNMVRKEAKDRTLVLSYNLNQQLEQATITDTKSIQENWQYTYDVFGRRIRKEQIHNNASTNKTEFIWDGLRLLQEKVDKRTFSYIYREEGFEPLAQIVLEAEQEEPQVNYLHTDQVGLPKELTDEKGELIWYAKYQTWGKVAEEHNLHQGHQPFRFQNQYYDAETGLHYNLMRYYDADSGRFSNQDPIGLMGGMNLYQYAPNPMGWIDPFGLALIRLRHYTSNKGFEGIKQSMVIKAGDQNAVFATKAKGKPFSMADAADKFKIKQNHARNYIDFDIDENRVEFRKNDLGVEEYKIKGDVELDEKTTKFVKRCG
ncbi:RHS repeat-associated core domain-containing protein [Neisseria sp. Ec49-e6-T10]|uniref:RHS repeat-associated core domain-containing protein n=1 Tax=Neisseria sp. Ec49-e6-T10 TaxID=3140744 RepID=UPI003EB9B528